MKKWIEFLASGFFSGYLPKAPGTFGTLAGVLIYALVSPYLFPYIAVVIILTVASVPVSTYAEKHIYHEKDSPHIVIDEMVGYFVTMLTFRFTPNLDGVRYLVMGFIFFRIFDIWKPTPIRQIQDLKGGWGVVLDDVLAGIFANLFLQLLRLNPFGLNFR